MPGKTQPLQLRSSLTSTVSHSSSAGTGDALRPKLDSPLLVFRDPAVSLDHFFELPDLTDHVKPSCTDFLAHTSLKTTVHSLPSRRPAAAC